MLRVLAGTLLASAFFSSERLSRVHNGTLDLEEGISTSDYRKIVKRNSKRSEKELSFVSLRKKLRVVEYSNLQGKKIESQFE